MARSNKRKAGAKPKTQAKAKAKAKSKPKAKTKPKAKAKAKAKRVAKPKAKPKAKAKSKPAVRGKAKPVAKARAKAVARAVARAVAGPKPKKSKSKPETNVLQIEPPPPPVVTPLDADAIDAGWELDTNEPTTAEPTPEPAPANGAMAPFTLTETSPGHYSLLLTQFEPASSVFEAAGVDGGGYAWEGIAKHVAESVVPELAGRFSLDPEASMFCAYGDDPTVLERLGSELARAFHDAVTLAAMIQQIGRDGFDD